MSPVTAFFISVTAFLASATEVYIINKNGNVHRLTLSIDKKTFQLTPVSSNEPDGKEAEQLYKIFKPYEEISQNLKPNLSQYRLFGNMHGWPKNKSLKKYKRPLHVKDNLAGLEPFFKYLITNRANLKTEFQDLTRFEKPLSEDYIDFADISRIQTNQGISQDYINFDDLRRKQDPLIKPALRTYNEEDSDENSSDDVKSKRFEVIKNKHNKKDIKSDSGSTEIDNSKDELDSDEDFSELSDRDTKPKKKTKKVKAKKSKKKKESVEDKDEPVEMLLQGNKLTMYPPMDKISDESSDDTRRELSRRLRMPYFLPKRYFWDREDIPNLGYFFFNGPKGRSQESD